MSDRVRSSVSLALKPRLGHRPTPVPTQTAPHSSQRPSNPLPRRHPPPQKQGLGGVRGGLPLEGPPPGTPAAPSGLRLLLGQRPLLWRSLPDSCSRGRRSTLESAPINITPRKKAPTWRWGPARPGVTSTWSKTAGCKSGRTQAPSRAACRGSLGFARIPTLAA